MNQPPSTASASASIVQAASARLSPKPELLPLWIWLGIAIAISVLGTPPDPWSMLMALACGLASFWGGVFFGAPLTGLGRIVPVLLLCAASVALALSNVASQSVVVGLAYLLFSIAGGFWASRRLVVGRFRVLAWFSVGYLLGSLVGAWGTAAGAVAGTLLAAGTLSISKDG